jgi:hypothetical protein
MHKIPKVTSLECGISWFQKLIQALQIILKLSSTDCEPLKILNQTDLSSSEQNLKETHCSFGIIFSVSYQLHIAEKETTYNTC